MPINKDSLKARANNIVAKLGIPATVVYDRFFFDALLARLAVSAHKDRFILKGGLYLSNVLGIDNRYTMDLDFYLKKTAMEINNVTNIIKDICAIDIHDGIVFKVLEATGIRQNDDYGGFEIKVLGKLDNVRCEFSVDVATGDPIIPTEINYGYRCLVTDDILQIKAYSVEFVIAEKLETVLERQTANSRSKDFYDLFMLRQTHKNATSSGSLSKACKETC